MKKVLKRKSDFRPFERKSNGSVIIMLEYQPVTNTMGWCLTHTFSGVPSISTVKQYIYEYYNEVTGAKIISGLTYHDKVVWLSMENQQNYKSDYDLAIQSDGANLPITIKIGDDANHEYVEFNTVEEYSEFYLLVKSHINQCIKEGWAKKDAINLDLYQ